MAENSHFAEVSVRFFKILFCPTSWFILKQLDNLPSLSMSDSQLGCASLTICSQTTRPRLASNATRLSFLGGKRCLFLVFPNNFEEVTNTSLIIRSKFYEVIV